jgi:peptidoglycan/LPS O-acetylase OafA/YrhL
MGRVRELDAVRGLAALAIVIYHFRAPILPFGWGAVDLFFVLSGYLITTIILVNGRSPGFLTTFYIRRGLRIWPIYYLSILAIILLGPVLVRPNNDAGLLYYLTYTQYFPHYWGGPVEDFSWYLKHTWTLAIEEQFYWIWPPLVILVGRRRLPWLALGVTAAAVLARSAGFHWWILVSRCDGFAIGALLAWGLLDAEWTCRHRRSIRRGLSAVGLASLVYLVTVQLGGGLPDHGPPPRPASTILALNLLFGAIVGLVASHAGHPALLFLRGPVLGYLGTISYGLYLYHMILLRIKMDYVAANHPAGSRALDGAVLVASFALAAVSWHLLERPILAWRDRFAYCVGSGQTGSTAVRVAGRIDAPHAMRTRRRNVGDGQPARSISR